MRAQRLIWIEMNLLNLLRGTVVWRDAGGVDGYMVWGSDLPSPSQFGGLEECYKFPSDSLELNLSQKESWWSLNAYFERLCKAVSL